MTSLHSLCAPELKPTRKLAPPRKPKQRGKKGGTREGSRNLATIQAELLAELEQAHNKGREIAVRRGQQGMDFCADIMARFKPQFDKDGKLIAGNMDECYRWAELMLRFAMFLGPYQSPRFAPIQPLPGFMPAQEDGKPKQTNVHVTILNSRGDVEWQSPQPKQIEGNALP
jgi:hypothetical protein